MTTTGRPRTRGRVVLSLALLTLAAWPGSRARAEDARRIAVLVGNNSGPRNRPVLSYAERDASDLAAVLGQLGGFRAEDIYLFRGNRLFEVRAAVARIRGQVSSIATTGTRVVLLFFFSGHSDGEALQLFEDRWQFSELRRELRDLGVSVRIEIVDSCHSGALLTQKGGKPGPSFDIRFTDDLATSGEAVLTSTAAHELALESGEISASFFSHHLVSGLRGAADSSGDGRVTLGEAYRYAFENTLAATANTTIGPQHPGYDFRLAGRGELVLTDLRAPAARLTLPTGFDRILIFETTRRRMIADVTDASARLIALPAGHYLVVGRKAERAYEATVDLPNGETRQLAVSDLHLSPGVISMTKGAFPSTSTEEGEPFPVAVRDDWRWTFGLGTGVTRGIADADPWLGTLRLNARWGAGRGLVLRGVLASRDAGEFRETQGAVGLGVFAGARRGRLAAHAAWSVDVGPVFQAIEGGTTFWTWVAGTGPSGGVTIALSNSVAVGVTAGIDALLLRRNGDLAFGFRPAAAAIVEWHR